MPQYWFIVEALIALARHRKGTGAGNPFTRTDLKKWSEKIGKRPAGAQHALDHLERCGLIRRAESEPESPGVFRYVVTREGTEAAKASYDSWKHQALAAAGAKASRPRAQGTFGARLWALLRMRKALDGTEAAETLVDAGANVKTAANTASNYLRQWSAIHPDAIQPSKKRATRGAVRYVLVKDIGPVPPVTTKPKTARGGAAA